MSSWLVPATIVPATQWCHKWTGGPWTY